MTTCRRTESILERLMDDVPLSTDDLVHLRSCGVCGPASSRVPAFNGALRFATQALATEPIPTAVLSAEALVPVREAPSRLLLGAAGLAVVVAAGLAIAFLRLDRGPDVGAPIQPALVTELQVVADLEAAGFTCSELEVEPTATPVAQGTMCHPRGSTAPLLAAIVVERDAGGAVGEIIAKASPDDAKDPDDARAVVGVLTAAVRAGVASPGTRVELETWVAANAGRLSPGESGLRLFGSLVVELERFKDEGLGLHITIAPKP